MQHSVIHQLIVITVKHFSYQEEIIFEAVAVVAQSAHKIMIQAVGNIQTKTVDIPVIYPEGNAVQKILNYFFIAQI